MTFQKDETGRSTPQKLNQNPGKQLQQAMEILPNFKAHWEKLIEEINVVSFKIDQIRLDQTRSD